VSHVLPFPFNWIGVTVAKGPGINMWGRGDVVLQY